MISQIFQNPEPIGLTEEVGRLFESGETQEDKTVLHIKNKQI